MSIEQRLIQFYQANKNRSNTPIGPTWEYVIKNHFRVLIAAIESGDEMKLAKCFTGSRDYLYGLESDQYLSPNYAQTLSKIIKKLGESFGVVDVHNPEQPSASHICDNATSHIIAAIEKNTGVKLSIKNVFGDQQGELVSPWKYLLTFNVIEAAYQRLAGKLGHVLEIGGGVGYAGLLAHNRGANSYTVIDLPEVAVISAYFIAKTLGEDFVWLHGEPDAPAFARYYPSTDCDHAYNRNYQLALNCDSLPEMLEDVRRNYIKRIGDTLLPNGIFFSVNHESDSGGQRSVLQSMSDNLRIESRHLFMMRDGYVEEVYVPKIK